MALKRTIISIEVLHDDSVDIASMELEDVAHEIIEGNSSGKIHTPFSQTVSEGEMASLCIEQGTNPCFILGPQFDDIEDCEDLENKVLAKHPTESIHITAVVNCNVSTCDDSVINPHNAKEAVSIGVSEALSHAMGCGFNQPHSDNISICVEAVRVLGE